MLTTLVMAHLLAAQPVTAQMVDQQSGDPETHEVAYEEIVDGNLQAALGVLEEALEDAPGEPAVLINLGSVHQQLGNLELARMYYSAALESDMRYEMELADGRWVDSRHLASQALGTLDGRQLAIR